MDRHGLPKTNPSRMQRWFVEGIVLLGSVMLSIGLVRWAGMFVLVIPWVAGRCLENYALTWWEGYK